VNVPWIGKDLGVVNMILGGTGLEKRRFPMETQVACGLHEEISLHLAASFTRTVSMPTCAPQDEDFGSYQRVYAFKDGVLACSRDVKLKTVEFSPAQYLRLKQTLKELQNDDRKSPVLATTGQTGAMGAMVAATSPVTQVESDSRMLEEREELQVKDAHSELVKVRFVKEILNYSGKKKESEVKIEFNPAVAEARLIRAVVTSKTGQRQEINQTEINVMDAGWNAQAKRYTGSKILVANLPGVDIGSTIEVEYEIAFHDKAFLSGFQSFQESNELVQKVFQVAAPVGLTVHTLDRGPAGIVTSDNKIENGMQTLTWKAANVKALPAENALPPNWLYQAGAVYFVGDAAAYLSELQRTLLDRSGHSAKAQELARKLTATAKTKLEAVKAIRDFVSSSIRSTGPSFTELPLRELSDAGLPVMVAGVGRYLTRGRLRHAPAVRGHDASPRLRRGRPAECPGEVPRRLLVAAGRRDLPDGHEQAVHIVFHLQSPAGAADAQPALLRRVPKSAPHVDRRATDRLPGAMSTTVRGVTTPPGHPRAPRANARAPRRFARASALRPIRSPSGPPTKVASAVAPRNANR